MATGSEKATAFEIKGLNQLLRVLNKLPKDLQNDIRDASNAIASDLGEGAKNAAAGNRQAALAATGLKVKRDRVPTIRAAGTIRPGLKAQDIFFGAEFGGGRRPTTQQFRPHRGQDGYWLYPTARARGKRYFEMWAEAVDKAFKQWDHREG